MMFQLIFLHVRLYNNHTTFMYIKLSSHICDTTRHDSMRHDTTGDQDTTVFKFGATHTTTRPCDTILTRITNSMTISWYAVNYHTFSQEDNSSTDKEYSKKG